MMGLISGYEVFEQAKLVEIKAEVRLGGYYNAEFRLI